MARKKKPEELLQNKWERLSRTHEKSFAAMRELTAVAIEGLMLTAKEALEAQKRGDKILKTYTDKNGEEREVEVDVTVANAVDVRAIGILSKALRDAVSGEREAVSLEYLDSNRAVAKVVQLGFLITREDGAIEVDARVVED